MCATGPPTPFPSPPAGALPADFHPGAGGLVGDLSPAAYAHLQHGPGARGGSPSGGQASEGSGRPLQKGRSGGSAAFLGPCSDSEDEGTGAPGPSHGAGGPRSPSRGFHTARPSPLLTALLSPPGDGPPSASGGGGGCEVRSYLRQAGRRTDRLGGGQPSLRPPLDDGAEALAYADMARQCRSTAAAAVQR